MENGKWIQIKASAPVAYLSDVEAVMGMISNSLMTEDYSDIEKDLDGVYGDLIDEELLARDRSTCAVSAFISDSANPAESVSFARGRFDELKIPAQIDGGGVSEEDWADSWKKYYKPIKTGKRVVIVPVWEKYDAAPGEVTVLMDPGMAFGTGTHETTRLCAAMLEKYIHGGESVLDVGCGSGILAITAAKLGAADAFACDIDPQSIKVAKENTVLNSTPCVECAVSDLLSAVPEKKYDVVCANIVADVIIRLAPDVGAFMKDGAVLIVSGIISERADEVRAALSANGFEVDSDESENGWYCAAVKAKRDL